jgi:hypothetical protein
MLVQRLSNFGTNHLAPSFDTTTGEPAGEYVRSEDYDSLLSYAELLADALRKIEGLTDREMADGDGAREIARAALTKNPNPAGRLYPEASGTPTPEASGAGRAGTYKGHRKDCGLLVEGGGLACTCHETCNTDCPAFHGEFPSRHQSNSYSAEFDAWWEINQGKFGGGVRLKWAAWAAWQGARHQVNREGALYSLADIRAVLAVHWLTEIQCGHDTKSDRSFCWCGSFICEPQPSVGEAVTRWVEHVMAQLPLHREACEFAIGKKS